MIFLQLFFIFFFVVHTIHGLGVVENNDCRKIVSVHTSRTLSSISPTEAVDAFKEYTWKKGGGLPVQVINMNEKERILLPLMATEELLEDNTDNQSQLSLTYHLRELGPIWRSEIAKDSHVAKLTFEKSNSKDTILTWVVEFTTKRNHKLWEMITQYMIGQACDNLQSYCAKPLLFSHTVEIYTSMNALEVVDQWIEYIWKNGGGLPLPVPPIPLTSDYYTRMIVPPFLIEQLVSIEPKGDECAQVVYTVKNPSILTYQVHSHLGRVYFKPTDKSCIAMLWEVNIRPMFGWEFFVKVFTSNVITALSNNFATSLQEPNVTVPAYGPNSWIGHVGDIFFHGNRDVNGIATRWEIKDIQIE